jgi:hypothetical protein
MKRRLEIIVEHERVVLSGRTRLWPDGWCASCKAIVQFAPPDQASILAEASLRDVFQWIEEGRLHFVEQQRELAVCLVSLEQIRTQAQHS